MTLSSGTRLGPYQLVAPLGAGGMGEVYRARDTRLDRTVAIKVLPPEVAQDADRRARFEREAKAIAALSHPHICTLHDVGEYAGTAYLVMELVEGETLAQRLTRGALPLDQALAIAGQIADALAAAHRQGIVHRDLKPANVMLTKSGAKLLDFGLAKLRLRTGPVALGHASDTATATGAAAGTAEGTILGTIHYMAPEQVEGKEADHRSDIWALGVLLYEMVTGVRPFSGDTAASVIGAILKDTPPLPSARQALSPPMLDGLVARCLEKDADGRWQSAVDVRQLLHLIDVRSAGLASAAPAEQRSRVWLPWLIAAATAAAAVAMALRAPTTGPAPPAAEVARFQLTLPEGLALMPEQPPAVSPDGRRLALIAMDRDSGRRQLYLRSLSSTAVQVVSGTEGAAYPFWSPDGTKLAFFGGTRLRTVDLQSGALQDVAAAANPGGPGNWVGTDLWYPRSNGPVVRVPATGGTPRAVAPFDTAREVNQSVAGVLADGRLLVSSQAGVFVVDNAGSASLLTDAITMPVMLMTQAAAERSTEQVLAFVRNGRLMAQRLDAAATALVGDAVEVAGEASRLVTQSARPFSSGANVIAFLSRSDIQTRPTWVSRDGAVLGQAASVTGQLRDVRLSPDGNRLALVRFTDQGRFEQLVVDLRRDTITRLVPQLSFMQATWTPDGRALLGVGTEGTGGRAIYRVTPAEGAAPELVLRGESSLPAGPLLSSDGTHMAYNQANQDGNYDIHVRSWPIAGDSRPIVSGEHYDSGANISPNGRWIAYHSNETGVLNVFVRSFPDGQDKLQISLDGGLRPVWRRDSTELYYQALDGSLMAATLAGATAPSVVARTRLFSTPLDPTLGTPSAMMFDVDASGERFVMLVPTSNVPQPVTVILNWQALLPARP